MKHENRSNLAILLMVGGAIAFNVEAHADERDPVSPTLIPNFQRFPDEHGQFASFSFQGGIDTSNPFFQDLGTNGRRCVTCHQPSDGWTVTPEKIRERFVATHGQDPIFRPNDGAGCPTADVSTLETRRHAYRLVLDKGLIRVGMKVPDSAEFTVMHVDNPYGCNGTDEVSVYRRPLPTSNVAYLSTVMWDGRETFKGKSIVEDLEHQAMDATLGHAQGAQAPTQEQLQQIVDFELQLFAAQVHDRHAGELSHHGAQGGPFALANTEYYAGINDPLGLNPTGKAFSPQIFTLYSNWLNESRGEPRGEARAAVARGEELFNTLPITITGVAGLNDVPLQDGKIHPTINGFCGTCHDSPNIGHHSMPAPLNIGLTDEGRRTADLPLITMMNKATGNVVRVSDPGRAMVTGKWADIGKFKGPILRALPTRAPYFHNGSAATLLDAVNFYDTRFDLHLSDSQKTDLVAFLKTL
ncbi:MAG TPA: hypothetical protein VET48_01730 [Steroidobacteraceae bacterium]|nr:hypothetical protein [Steroidobacteraceae bacterium]